MQFLTTALSILSLSGAALGWYVSLILLALS
jgi:hypothetical protein